MQILIVNRNLGVFSYLKLVKIMGKNKLLIIS
jgi:hypothetical protein